MRLREVVRGTIDAGLERSVFGSFSRMGFVIRRRLYSWPPLNARVDGETVVVTGATSGLGREVARSMADLGAHVVMVVRDRERGDLVRDEIIARTGNPAVKVVVADLGDLESVRVAAATLQRLDAIHALVHNAGTLAPRYNVDANGTELTVVAQLLGPFLLTELVMGQLATGRARVIWVTSGGMYTQPLEVDALEMGEEGFDGVKAYARVKRAQVSLVERWAPDLVPRGITMVAMHPGWADTPGIRMALPTFRRLMAPFLRSSAEGADTIIWLVTARGKLTPGGLWLDRRSRPLHRLGRTRRSDTPMERDRLFAYCLDGTGASAVGRSDDA